MFAVTIVFLQTFLFSLSLIAQMQGAQAPAPTGPVPTFTAPIPIGSNKNQVGVGPATQSFAEDIIFFVHPQPLVGSVNYSQIGIQLGGTSYLLDDVVAVPGLISSQGGFGNYEGFFSLGERSSSSVTPLHGMCPRRIEQMTTTGNPDLFWTFDCKVQIENVFNRQLHISDVRNTVAPDEFALLFAGANPLEQSLIGNADEEVTPYTTRSYPSTVKLNDYPFTWPLLQPPNGDFDEVIPFGLADIGEGIVTAAYDPFMVRLHLQLYGEGFNPPSIDLFDLGVRDVSYFSPVTFFAKNDRPGIGRVQFAGYAYSPTQVMSLLPPSSAQLVAFQLEALSLAYPQNMLHHNFTPIDVVAMQFPQKQLSFFPLLVGGIAPTVTRNFPTIRNVYNNLVPSSSIYPTSFPDDGFAVLNQGALVNLDQIFAKSGGPYVSSDGRAHPWSYYLGTSSLTRTGAISLVIPSIAARFGGRGAAAFQDLQPALLPHRSVSSVVFWSRGRDWGGEPQKELLNPNSVFTPFAMSLVGPEAYDAFVAIDRVGSTPAIERQSLVVPSGVGVVDANAVRRFYLYKIDPIHNILLTSRDINAIAPSSARAASAPLTHILLPEVYEIDVPQGFAPYKGVASDIDDDGCADVVLTFRGQQTVSIDPNFQNQRNQRLVFQVSASDRRMFSDRVYIYHGVAPTCAIERTPRTGEIFQLPPDELGNPGQATSVVVADFDGNGTDNDILIGDLLPRRIGGDPNAQVTAHAFLFFDASSIQAPRSIRIGYAAGGQLSDPRNFAEGRDPGPVGVKSLAVNIQPNQGANIAGIAGLPVVNAPTGCPGDPQTDPNNVQAASIPELYYALAQNLWDRTQNTVVPHECAPRDVCAVNAAGNAVDGRHLPFWITDSCCNPCAADANGVGWNDPTQICRTRLRCGSVNNPFNDVCNYFDSICLPLPGPNLYRPGRANVASRPLPSTYRPDQVVELNPRWIADRKDLMTVQTIIRGLPPQFPPPPPQIPMGLNPTPPQAPVVAPRVTRAHTEQGEMTVIVNTGNPQTFACNPRGTPQAPANCNLDTRCPANDQFCDPATCQCRPECTNVCPTGQVRTADCQCIQPGDGPVGPVIYGAVVADDCHCFADGFSSEEARKNYTVLNDEYRQVSGKQGDLFGEPEFSVMKCVCCINNASAKSRTAANLSLSLSGNVLPDEEGNVRPWMLVQVGGPVMEDFTQREFRPASTTLVTQPIRVLPEHPDQAISIPLLLPSVSSLPNFPDPQPMSSLVPVEIHRGRAVYRLNNMLQHRLLPLERGESISVAGRRFDLPAVTTNAPQGAPVATNALTVLPDAGYACHVIDFRLPPHEAQFTGVAGGPKNAIPIEQRQLDWGKVKSEIRSRREAQELVGGSLHNIDLIRPTSISWDPPQNYQFIVVNDVFGKSNEPVPAPQERALVFLGGMPQQHASGTNCRCDMNATSPSMPTLILLFLFVMGTTSSLIGIRYVLKHKESSRSP